MMRKKKAVSQVFWIIAMCVIILVALFLGLPIIKNFFSKAKDTGELAIYKSRCDYDYDGITIGDTCPCDPGKIEDSDIFWLRGEPVCVITKDNGKYKLSSGNKESCKRTYDKLILNTNNCLARGNPLEDGFSPECAEEILQIDPRTDEFATRCETLELDCDKKLIDYCKGKV